MQLIYTQAKVASDGDTAYTDRAVHANIWSDLLGLQGIPIGSAGICGICLLSAGIC